MFDRTSNKYSGERQTAAESAEIRKLLCLEVGDGGGFKLICLRWDDLSGGLEGKLVS